MTNNHTNRAWKNHVLGDIHELNNKTVVIRVDWNMPVAHEKITDTSRFDVTLPFIKSLSFIGIKTVIMTHFGQEKKSLEVVANHAKEILSFLHFEKSTDFNEIQKSIQNLKRGDALLLENVRLWKGEEENLPSLSRSFASLGDVFINDAFSVSHREHSSVVGIAKNMLSYFGPTFVRELEHLSEIVNPKKPALLIMGGAKISAKLPLIEKYLDQGVGVFVGGALAHNILKARGIEIGKSVYDTKYKISETLLNHPLLLTPLDVILESGERVSVFSIPKDGVVVDCGEETEKMLEKNISSSKTVIVNGPLGWYEKGFLHGTEKMLSYLGHADVSSYIGGGDTVNVAHSLHLLNRFKFVSLGGGAMLDFLSSGTLPGIDAIVTQ